MGIIFSSKDKNINNLVIKISTMYSRPICTIANTKDADLPVPLEIKARLSGMIYLELIYSERYKEKLFKATRSYRTYLKLYTNSNAMFNERYVDDVTITGISNNTQLGLISLNLSFNCRNSNFKKILKPLSKSTFGIEVQEIINNFGKDKNYNSDDF